MVMSYAVSHVSCPVSHAMLHGHSHVPVLSNHVPCPVSCPMSCVLCHAPGSCSNPQHALCHVSCAVSHTTLHTMPHAMPQAPHQVVHGCLVLSLSPPPSLLPSCCCTSRSLGFNPASSRTSRALPGPGPRWWLSCVPQDGGVTLAHICTHLVLGLAAGLALIWNQGGDCPRAVASWHQAWEMRLRTRTGAGQWGWTLRLGSGTDHRYWALTLGTGQLDWTTGLGTEAGHWHWASALGTEPGAG